jgi:hypothetical protein
MTAEMSSDGRQPTLLEKKRNTAGGYPAALSRTRSYIR